MLNVHDKIDAEEYKFLSTLRRKRNGLIHKGEKIDKVTSDQALTINIEIIRNYMRDIDVKQP
jgi:uncharacterized protein YutE (UPF0331/DUF86 family)